MPKFSGLANSQINAPFSVRESVYEKVRLLGTIEKLCSIRVLLSLMEDIFLQNPCKALLLTTGFWLKIIQFVTKLSK
jgi:hypothetical protein